MNRKQHGHRTSVNDSIVLAMQDHPDRWLTSNQISKFIDISYTRSVGRRLNFLCEENPHIESCTVNTTHKRYFRYNTVVKSAGTLIENEQNKTGDEMI